MTARTYLTALFTGLCALQLSAQTPTPTQTPVFTSAVDMARMDVRVTDKSGRPITDLRADEVQVIEGGVQRPVVLLQRVSEAGRSYVEAAQRTVAAEISTNQGAPRGQLYVLLFDQEHITAGAEQKARVAAEKFIREKVRPEDRVAVYGLPAPGPTQSFTNNTRAAIDQLQHVRGGLTRLQTQAVGEITVNEAYEILRGNEAVLTRFLLPSDENTSSRASAIADLAKKAGTSAEEQRRTLQQAAQDIVTRADGDARRFLQFATELLRNFRHVDGRKTIVLFSEGFFGDRVATEARTLAAAAAETYSVIYALDLNTRMDVPSTESTASDTVQEILSRTQTLSSLAAETGGALIPDALTHLDSALGSLGAPNTDYYIVGFESSTEARGNRTGYQKVDVKVTRPGAVVDTRTGYTAGLDARSMNAYESLRRLTIDNALAAPYGHQGLRVEYTTYQSHGSGPNSERVVLSLEAELPVAVPGGDGALPQKADVVFVVREARTGRVVGSGSDQIPLPMTVARGRTSGVGTWRVQFMVAPGDYIMRAIVREPGGLLGSADRQFTVRTMGGPDVAPSDLILGKPTPALPVRATAYTAEPLPAAVRVYARSATQLEKVVGRLELLPLGGTTPVIGLSGVASDTRDIDGQELRDLLFEIPLANVPAGEYVARVELRSAGEFVAELRRQVTVVVGANPNPTAAVGPEPVVASAAADGVVATALLKAAAGSNDPAVLQAVAGVTQLKAGRYTDAVATLKSAFEAGRSTSAPVAFLLGWAERGAGNLVGAVSAFRNAANLDGAMIPAHLALATTYLELQQPALAAQALEAGLAKQPNAIELSRLLETIKK